MKFWFPPFKHSVVNRHMQVICQRERYFNMNKLSIITLISIIALITLSVPAYALPDASVKMAIRDAKWEGEEIIFTVDISIDSPSEPYSSLDFNLVSSNNEKLSIINKNPGSDNGALDITFAEKYGSAYHPGRFDESSGEGRYMMGIYSQTGKNDITEATDVCSVRMKYSGTDTQVLSISDLKLVYENANGAIVNTAIATGLPSLQINESIVASESLSIYIIIGALVALAIIATLIVLGIRKQKSKKTRRKRVTSN